jgi:hypothetical protein
VSDPAVTTAPPSGESVEPERDDRVPALARAFAIVLLITIAYCGWQAIEKWPFTGWRLYSNTKGNTAGSYFAFRVDADGAVHRVDYTELPDAYSRAPYLLEKFDRYPDARREAVCDAIADGERGEQRDVEAIHIYWERYRVRIVDGERVKDRIERDFRWSCAEAPGYDGPPDGEAAS